MKTTFSNAALTEQMSELKPVQGYSFSDSKSHRIKCTGENGVTKLSKKQTTAMSATRNIDTMFRSASNGLTKLSSYICRLWDLENNFLDKPFHVFLVAPHFARSFAHEHSLEESVRNFPKSQRNSVFQVTMSI